MKAARWLKLVVLAIALVIAARMVLRYLDWQASEANRSAASAPDR